MKFSDVVMTLLFALCLYAPAEAFRPGDAVCTLGFNNTCAADEIVPSTLDSSVLIYPGGKTRCAFDDFEDSKVDFKTNQTYFFQVFPNKQQKTKLLVFFQGGGACIDRDTCNFALQCSLGKDSTFSTYASAQSSGVMNRTNPENVFRDWNIVHIPYCSGDLHVGDTEIHGIDSPFSLLLGKPQCLGKNMPMHMTGYENSLSALTWAVTNYPKPEHLVLGGASAGSIAAQVLSAYVASLWNLTDASPTRYSVIGDSYAGVFPQEKRPAGSVMEYFGACDVDLKAPATVVAACKNKTMSAVELVSAMLRQLPFSYWLFIDSKADRVQRFYYQLMEDSIIGFPFTKLLSGEKFFTEMTTITTAYRAVSSRFSTFFVEGEAHVFTADDNYTRITSDAGVALGDFLAKWLQSVDPSQSTTQSATSAPSPNTPSASAAMTMTGTTCTLLSIVAVVLALFQ